MAYAVLSSQSASGIGTAAWANQIKDNFDAICDSSGMLMYPAAGTTNALWCERHANSNLRHIEAGFGQTASGASGTVAVTWVNAYTTNPVIVLGGSDLLAGETCWHSNASVAGATLHAQSGATPVTRWIHYIAEGPDT